MAIKVRVLSPLRYESDCVDYEPRLPLLILTNNDSHRLSLFVKTHLLPTMEIALYKLKHFLLVITDIGT